MLLRMNLFDNRNNNAEEMRAELRHQKQTAFITQSSKPVRNIEYITAVNASRINPSPRIRTEIPSAILKIIRKTKKTK